MLVQLPLSVEIAVPTVAKGSDSAGATVLTAVANAGAAVISVAPDATQTLRSTPNADRSRRDCKRNDGTGHVLFFLIFAGLSPFRRLDRDLDGLREFRGCSARSCLNVYECAPGVSDLGALQLMGQCLHSPWR
jgi:hypothetical protein